MMNKLVPRKKRDISLRQGPTGYPFDLLQREVNDLFDSYSRGCGKRSRFDSLAGFDVSETDNEIRIRAELPGMNEKDIEVSLDEDVVTIRAERKSEHEETKRNYNICKMSSSSFLQRFPLRAAINREKVTATFTRGVLTLTLPKTEQAKAERRRIPIRAE